MENKIIHDSERCRFEMERDGTTAYVEYVLEEGGVFDILHTVVPPPLEGQGIAASLVKQAYEYARNSGLRLKATCSYAAIWLKRHPDV